MQKDYRKLIISISIIVIAMLVAYTFITYLPHEHECIDADCTICNMVDSKNDILTGAALLSTAQLLPLLSFIFLFAYKQVVSFGKSTPVGLKVKLLD